MTLHEYLSEQIFRSDAGGMFSKQVTKDKDFPAAASGWADIATYLDRHQVTPYFRIAASVIWNEYERRDDLKFPKEYLLRQLQCYPKRVLEQIS